MNKTSGNTKSSNVRNKNTRTNHNFAYIVCYEYLLRKWNIICRMQFVHIDMQVNGPLKYKQLRIINW